MHHSEETKHGARLAANSEGCLQSSESPQIINIENIINISHNAVPTKAEGEVQRHPSPNPSLRSTSISIASIDSDALSSVIESDVDEFEDTNTGCMVKKLGEQTKNPTDVQHMPQISPEIGVLLGAQIARDVSTENGVHIASLSLTNTTDVTFGHKKFHQGHVTIQQVFIEKPTLLNGSSNPAFCGSNDLAAAARSADSSEHGNQRGSLQTSNIIKKFKNHKAAIITAVIIVLAFLVGLVVVLAVNTSPTDTLGDVPYQMVTRNEWVAQPPNVPLVDQETPVPRVIITDTCTQNCTNRGMCILRTRVIQTFDMESKSLDDIRYNFLVGGDSNVYIGRGWDKVGAHTKFHNRDSVGIAFIGCFDKWTPPEEQINATKWLVSEGVRLKKIAPDYKLYGSRQLDELAKGPSDKLFEIIKTWPHWSDNAYVDS